jgi:hypothetical protein
MGVLHHVDTVMGTLGSLHRSTPPVSLYWDGCRSSAVYRRWERAPWGHGPCEDSVVGPTSDVQTLILAVPGTLPCRGSFCRVRVSQRGRADVRPPQSERGPIAFRRAWRALSQTEGREDGRRAVSPREWTGRRPPRRGWSTRCGCASNDIHNMGGRAYGRCQWVVGVESPAAPGVRP